MLSRLFTSSLIFRIWIMMCRLVDFFGFSYLNFPNLLNLWLYIFYIFWKISVIISSDTLLVSASFSSLCGILKINMLGPLLFSHRSLSLGYIFEAHFLYVVHMSNSIDLSANSSSVISSLLLTQSSDFFVFIIAFFSSIISIWFFYMTSILLMRFSIFSFVFRGCVIDSGSTVVMAALKSLSDKPKMWFILVLLSADWLIFFSHSSCDFLGSGMTDEFLLYPGHLGDSGII